MSYSFTVPFMASFYMERVKSFISDSAFAFIYPSFISLISSYFIIFHYIIPFTFFGLTVLLLNPRVESLIH